MNATNIAREPGNMNLLNSLRALAWAPFRWLVMRFAAHRRARRLRLLETLSLGANRFLAVVQVEQREFLVGSAGNSIVLLARLDPAAGEEAEKLRRGGGESWPAEVR